jgi:ankyrin repeat protein
MRTPLHYACYQGHVEVVSMLLQAGADTEARSKVSARCVKLVIFSVSMAPLRSTMPVSVGL